MTLDIDSAVDRSWFSRIVALNNSKGGVYKTSLVTNLAGILAAGGMRVLLVDLDPQGDTSVELGCKDLGLEGKHLADAIREQRPLDPTQFIPARENLDLIAGGEELESLQFEGYTKEQSMDLLLAVFGTWVGDYDIVFIDTPPSSLVYIYAAMGVARYLLMPTKADVASIDRMAKAVRTMADVRERNEFLEPIGVVLTGVSRNSHAVRKAAEERIRAMSLGPFLFKRTVSATEAVAQVARERSQLIHEIAGTTDEVTKQAIRVLQENRTLRKEGKEVKPIPRSLPAAKNLAKDYMDIAQELAQRIATQEAQA